MSEKVTLVDRGRGLQLLNSRVTVQDLVPFFQQKVSYDEIQRWSDPNLTKEEIALVERYYRDHQAALDEEDRLIRKRTEERMRDQAAQFPAYPRTHEERMAYLKQLVRERREGRNGAQELLADADCQGLIEYLVQQMQAELWIDFWNEIGMALVHFEDIGLKRSSTDAEIWRVCQAEGLLLITNNRNAAEPDSLEETIRVNNTPECLPVFTISDMEKLRTSPLYVQEVIDSLFTYLFRIDSVRGTGRLYLPIRQNRGA